jgi:hypothetical protein
MRRTVPSRTRAAGEARDALGGDVLAADPERRLLAAGGAFLLFAQHDPLLAGFHILAEPPDREAVFVLLFSGRRVRAGRKDMGK